MGRHSRAGKSKAVHALARRVGKALYYCHLKNEPFDDSGYQALLAESSYLAGQGQCMGRDGRVEVRYAADGTILLGGCAVTCVEGRLAAGDHEHSEI